MFPSLSNCGTTCHWKGWWYHCVPSILSRTGENYRNVYFPCSVWLLDCIGDEAWEWFVAENKGTRRWPCQTYMSPHCYPVGHPSLRAVCGQCLSNTGLEEVSHLGFGSFRSYCKRDCFQSSGCTQFLDWSLHRARPVNKEPSQKEPLELVPLFISSLWHSSASFMAYEWPSFWTSV